MKKIAMLPVQFKYSYNPTKVNQILSIPDFISEVPSPLNIVLCEGNTSSGTVAMKATQKIKEKYPEAKIYLATLTKVNGCPDKLEGIEEIFHGVITNEKFNATPEEIIEHKMREGITIFPWEDPEAELTDINA